MQWMLSNGGLAALRRDVLAPCIFSGDLVPEVLLPLWETLSRVIQHYFRPRPADETKEDFRKAIAKAGRNLRSNAVGLEELLQQHLNCVALARLFTINLHGAFCRYGIIFDSQTLCIHVMKQYDNCVLGEEGFTLKWPWGDNDGHARHMHLIDLISSLYPPCVQGLNKTVALLLSQSCCLPSHFTPCPALYLFHSALLMG